MQMKFYEIENDDYLALETHSQERPWVPAGVLRISVVYDVADLNPAMAQRLSDALAYFAKHGDLPECYEEV